MKKIVAVIMLIMGLSMKPLFAADIDKASEQGKKIKAILEESARKKAEFEEHKREEDLAIKTREELEARKQQELQKKLDELKAQEEKAQEQKAREKEAAEKKSKEEAEAAKLKKQAEDPRKQITDVLADLFAATKKYANADAETNAVKKAEQIKSGDALFKRAVAGLHESLKDFSYEEIKKIVSTMGLKLETQFMVLQNLIEAYVDHPKAVEESHSNVLGDFISALLDTMNIDALPEFLMKEFPSKADPKKKIITGADILHNIQILMLPLIEAPQQEKLLAGMVRFTEKLVEVLNKASADRREHLANVLLNWVRLAPVTGNIYEQILMDILNKLRIDQLSKEAPFILHDWLTVFNKSKNVKFLTALRQQYLNAVYNNGTLPVLRSALQMLNRNLPYPELFKLQKAYLALMTEPAIIALIKDVDSALIVSTFKEILKLSDEHKWADGEKLLTDVINTLNKTIKTFRATYQAASEVNKSKIGEQLKKLQALKDQLDGMVLPKGLWGSIADFFKSKNVFEPDIRKWDEKSRARLLLNITDQNYNHGTFVSVEDFVKALRNLMEKYHFYENNPEIQKLLLADAGKYFKNDLANTVIPPEKLDAEHKKLQEAFYAILGLDLNLIVFLKSNFPKEFSFIGWLLGVNATRKATVDNDSRYLKNLDGILDYSKNEMGTTTDTNPRTGQTRITHPITGWMFMFININSDAAYKIIDAMTDNQFKNFIESMHTIIRSRELVIYENLFSPSLDKIENHQRAMALKDAFNELKDHRLYINSLVLIDRLSNSASPIKYFIDDTIDQNSLMKTLDTIGKELDKMNDSTFANIIRPIQEQQVDKVDLGQRAAVLFNTVPYVKNAQRAKALLDALMHVFYDPQNANVQFDAYGLPITDAGLRKALGEIEEQLKAQQESEAKTKASAATSASTSSASSETAPSTSASSSSANVTASGSTSSTSLSVPALSRGIGAVTQSRS